jgi:hypothetical protein
MDLKAQLTTQISSAAAGRLDSTNTTNQGAGGLHNSIVQNWAMGKSKLDATTTADAANWPWWAWAIIGVGLVLVVTKIINRNR